MNPTSPGRKTVVVWETDDVSSSCIGMIGTSYEVGGANCIDPASVGLSPATGNVNEAVTITVTGSESDLLYRFWVNNDPFCTAPANPDWGIGQVQSKIDVRVTVNFEHCGKVVINGQRIELIVVVQR